MTTNILFISVFNLPAIELAKNHIKSLLQAGISNTIIKCFVTDKECVDLLQDYGVETIVLTTTNISNTYLAFSSPKFNELCIYRYTITLELLNHGYDVWYMDIDTVVTQDLLPTYNAYKQTHDIVTQNDLNMPCTGCMMFYNTENTIQFLKQYIHVYTNQTELNDQCTLLNVLLRYAEPLRFDVFPWNEFACGVLYFKELHDKASSTMLKYIEEFETNRATAKFIHANWMVGNDIKIEALKKYGHWYI